MTAACSGWWGRGCCRPATFEYACHEGNYSIVNMLSGARAEEQTAAESTSR